MEFIKIADLHLRNKSFKYSCAENHFVIKLQASRLQLYYRKHPLQVIFRDIWQEELHFITTYKTAFCSSSSFADHHSRTAPKLNMKQQFTVCEMLFFP